MDILRCLDDRIADRFEFLLLLQRNALRQLVGIGADHFLSQIIPLFVHLLDPLFLGQRKHNVMLPCSGLISLPNCGGGCLISSSRKQSPPWVVPCDHPGRGFSFRSDRISCSAVGKYRTYYMLHTSATIKTPDFGRNPVLF